MQYTRCTSPYTGVGGVVAVVLTLESSTGMCRCHDPLFSGQSALLSLPILENVAFSNLVLAKISAPKMQVLLPKTPHFFKENLLPRPYFWKPVWHTHQKKVECPKPYTAALIYCTFSKGTRVLRARFLAPRPRIAPLSFAPTRTGPKNSKFYGPDPGPTQLYFPRTGPDRNNLASTRN